MSWVNLNDVYVNQTGGTIAGDLSVNGALTVNDGKGTNTTYNVANEITTLRDSVSHAELLWSGSVYGGGSFVVPNLNEYTFIDVVCSNADENYWHVLCLNDIISIRNNKAYSLFPYADMHVGETYVVSIKSKLDVQGDLKTVKFCAGYAFNVMNENHSVTSHQNLRIIAVYGIR